MLILAALCFLAGGKVLWDDPSGKGKELIKGATKKTVGGQDGAPSPGSDLIGWLTYNPNKSKH